MLMNSVHREVVPDKWSKVVVTAGAVSVAAVVGWSIYQWAIRTSSQYIPESSETGCIDLITTERNNLNYAMSISCVDFFDGKIDYEILQQRVTSTISANPWLSSRIKTINGKRKAVYPIHFNEASIGLYLKQVTLPHLNLTSSYNEIVRMLQPHEVPMGCFCVDKDVPLFQVVLAKVVEEKKYALLVSMCHVIGDGATFYNIFNMLNPALKSPYAMNCIRIQTYESELANRVSSKVLKWLDSSLIIVGVLYSICFKSKASVGVFRVNAEQIELTKSSLKKESSDAAQIISTNDILTSWAVQTCGAPFGMMAINLRNRMAGITNHHAGNYQHLIMYRIDDCRNPADIRNSLKLLASNSDAVPSVLDTVMFDFLGVSNWASFYQKDLTFPNCKHELHLPLLASNTLFVRGIVIIFRPRADEIGLVVLDRNQSMDKWLSAGGYLKDKILT